MSEIIIGVVAVVGILGTAIYFNRKLNKQKLENQKLKLNIENEDKQLATETEELNKDIEEIGVLKLTIKRRCRIKERTNRNHKSKNKYSGRS